MPLAYIGPGAGFAFLGSSFAFLLALLMAAVTVLLWPVFWVVRAVRGQRIKKNARTRRVVVVGLDGLEPSLAERYIAEGKLPNLKRLAESGCYSPLGTTLPALSPVAWSTFQTGVNPGGHNIFDFLTRDKRHCLPMMSSSQTEFAGGLKLFGKLRLINPKPVFRILRRSQPFWKVLGKHGVFSNVLRVPISYPPEPFAGNLLSAMCTPDLRGTQGTFSLFSSSLSEGTATGGELHPLRRVSECYHGELIGPADPRSTDSRYANSHTAGSHSANSHSAAPAPLKIPFSLKLLSSTSAELSINSIKQRLELDQLSPWLELTFSFGRKRIRALARFCLRQTEPDVRLYVSPVNAHPESPAFPISHPRLFSNWLSKKLGVYGTLGLMEDTWGRNEHALDDATFLEQTWLTHDERERMFFELLQRTREGLCVCVFDASDRIQHMFWRYLDDKHPSPREPNPKFLNTIPEMYQRMDQLVGRTLDKLGERDVLIVLSDHGFQSFRRCINLNSWLHQNGYLALKSNTGADYFGDVDWKNTRAFAVGLTGVYINLQGRELQGTVSAADYRPLKQEIVNKLQLLRDDKPVGGDRRAGDGSDDAPPIRRVYDSEQVYRGLYTAEAPDLIVGYGPGYRVSWDSVTGKVEPTVFSDNTKAWSGDHHIDPAIIPGVLFSNLKLRAERPRIIDMAPTILDLFAIKPPAYMEGRVVL